MEIECRQLREMAARYGAQIERARRDLVYRCDLCGADFYRPVARRWREARPDGFQEPFCQTVCPMCGAEEQYFEEVEEDGDENGKRGNQLHAGGG